MGLVIRGRSWRAIAGVIATALVGLALVPGPWTGPPSAPVRFSVDAGSGLVQPVARVAPRCGRRTVRFGLAAVVDGRFVAVARRGRRVRLRVAGRFSSPTAARGVLRGRVGRCRVRPVAWRAAPVGVAADPAEEFDEETIVDDDSEPIDDGEEFEEDDFGEEP